MANFFYYVRRKNKIFPHTTKLTLKKSISCKSVLGMLEFDIPDFVYYPQEDSLLLAEVIEKISKNFKGKKILEIGCGSGFISVLLAKLTGDMITATDINPKAVENTVYNAKINHVKIKAKQSNLFNKINKRFDIIIFNPPYIPVKDKNINKELRQQWSVFDGNENIIRKFIMESKKYLARNGKIILLFSSLNRDIPEILKANGFNIKILGKQKIDWEELFVIEGRL